MGLLQKKSSISKPKEANIKALKDNEEFPIPVFQFSVVIADIVVALFQKVSGMSVTRDVEPLDIGGQNDFGTEFPGKVSFGHITFETGLSSSDFFWKWMMEQKEIGFARVMNFDLYQRRSNMSGPKPLYEDIKHWSFANAFPVSWKISSLDVDNSKNIVIESLELSFDYFELKS